MKKQERAQGVIDIFNTIYPDTKCSLNYETPLQMLIATQLSAQCTDARVNIVTADLFKKYPSCEAFANADYDTLCDDIRSIGFFRNKAKNIILCCKRLLEVYDGQVPDTMEDLLTLAGTGRKTANLVLGDIFGKPAVVVDTHCMRLSRRIGLTTNETPEKIEYDLKKLIPPEFQLSLCHQLVNHGRLVCTARSPKCEICQVSHLCKTYLKK
ncbi:MAG: endonuclease III [Ruminococcaceae bacterium]|nr:endonuclease III [Oscillospiraceae bacterium]